MSSSTCHLSVLLVDDEESWLSSFSISLRAAGVDNILTCSDSRNVEEILSNDPVGLVVLDLTMPHRSGKDVLTRISAEFPDVPVIVVTGMNDLETAVDCMKIGALDYYVKTDESDRLIAAVTRALEMQQLRAEHSRVIERLLDDRLEHPEAFEDIVGESQKMRSIFRYLEAIGPSAEPVFITGETGVGKELFARAVHALSGRSGDFVAINSAGLDDHVFTDTLFGHKKGAFTGADAARPGMIERAQGGTLFLDELGDLSVPSQVKLLRVLQEREYYPLGSDVSKKTDARVVVATNRDVAALIDAGEFRRDLYFRLSTHQVHIPPLREHKEDLRPLLEQALEEAAEQLDKPNPTYPRELLTLLRLYTYPGNVREFKAMVHEAVTHHKGGVLSMDRFRKHMKAFGVVPPESSQIDSNEQPVTFPEELPTLKEMDHLLIEEAMSRAEGNQSMAAQMLGISRQALNKRLKQQELR